MTTGHIFFLFQGIKSKWKERVPTTYELGDQKSKYGTWSLADPIVSTIE